MARLLQLRRGISSLWASTNPILADGEIVYDKTAGTLYVGDGVTHKNDLIPVGLATSFSTVDILAGSDPGAAASGHMTIYGKAVAGRIMLKVVGPSGLDYAAQPWLARNKIGIWQPPGNATTLPAVFGYTAPTFVGVPATRSVSTTNFFTRMRRLGYLSTAATAGSMMSCRIPAAQVSTGTGSMGGFHKILRFGISDAAAVSTARMFIGMSSSTTAPTNVEPSTLLNCIGIGHGAADTNFKLFYGGSTAQTPIDLGVNFPANTLSTDAYELALFSPPSGGGEVYWEITRLNTGDVASGIILPSGGVALPGSTTLLSYNWGYRTNNATALSVGLDLMGDYIETDN